MAPPGRRASMRSVRTLPVVHEDEVNNGDSSEDSIPAYPIRQNRHSGVVTALPPLLAVDGNNGPDEDGEGDAVGNEFAHGRSRHGGSGGSGSHRGSIHRPPHLGPHYPYAHPAYSESSEESGITDRKLEHMSLPKRSQNRDWFSKRGGWWRLILTFVLLAAIAVGLGIGLKFGLASKPTSSSSDGTNTVPATPAAPQTTQFPAGSYSFTVALTNVSMGCTDNGFAFGCYPSTVYSQSSAKSQNDSAATFYWSIAGTTSRSTTSPSTITTYKISSRDGSSSSSSVSSSSFTPPSFQNVDMQHLDAGQDTERLVFNFSMTLAYVPTSDLIAAQTSSATCFYNQTMFSATLWTRRRATYPSNVTSAADPSISNSTEPSGTYETWPFAVEISEIQQAGPTVPDCLDYHGKSLGDFSANTTSASGGSAATQCGCWYTNAFDTGNANGTTTR